MSNEIYDYIVFSGKDLKDLTVIQEDKSTSSETAVSRGGTGFTVPTSRSVLMFLFSAAAYHRSSTSKLIRFRTQAVVEE